MPFAGDWNPAANPGETQPFTLDMTSQLINGDTISGTPTVSIAVYDGVDANASSWLVGSPTVVGNLVSQVLGGAFPNGLQPGVVYRLTFTVNTTQGKTLVNYAHIACANVA